MMTNKYYLNGEKEALEKIETSFDQGYPCLSFSFKGKDYFFQILKQSCDYLILQWEQQRFKIFFFQDQFLVRDKLATIVKDKLVRQKKKNQEAGDIISPMPGRILKVMVTEGSTVKSGDSLLILEAMKMEHTLKAPRDGKVGKIFFKEGQLVEGGVELVKFL